MLEAVDVADVGNFEIIKAHYNAEYRCRSEKHTSEYNVDTAKYTYNKHQNEELHKGDIESIVKFVHGPVKIYACVCGPTGTPCTCPTLESEHVMTCLRSSDSVVKVRKDHKKIEKVHKFDDNQRSVDNVYLVVRKTDDPTVHVYRVRVLQQGENLDAVTNRWTKDEGEPLEVQYIQNGTTYDIRTYHQKQNGRMCAIQGPHTPKPPKKKNSRSCLLPRSSSQQAYRKNH